MINSKLTIDGRQSAIRRCWLLLVFCAFMLPGVVGATTGGKMELVFDCQKRQQVLAWLKQAQWRLVGGEVLPLHGLEEAATTLQGNLVPLCAIPAELPDAAIAALYLPAMASLVVDDYGFAGLATFYNSVAAVRLDEEGELHLSAELETPGPLGGDEWVGSKGRFEVALVSAPAATVAETADGVLLQFTEAPPALRLFVGLPRDLVGAGFGQNFNTIRYAHLWGWLAALCRFVEWALVGLFGIVGNWGLAIFVLAVLVRILLLPVGILTQRWQIEVSKNQAVLAPQLAEIKANYDGEEAHNRIMAAHKALGITPFFTLKPLFASLIQIPILVAIFNALGEMPQLNGAQFLWIANLSYPDAVARLPFAIPMLGNTLNLLPFVMTAVSLAATLLHRNAHAPEAEVRRQRRNLYLMTAAFFLLFYPFPAAMVLYWTLANGLQMVQQPLVQVWTERGIGRTA